MTKFKSSKMLYDSWSSNEITLILADYFSMLSMELRGEHYSKAEHRRVLMPLLANRSEGSVEFKHQNISALLAKLGQPYIRGYLPRYNYQQVLDEKVIEYLNAHPELEPLFRTFSEREVHQKKQTDFNELVENAPEPERMPETQSGNARNPVKVNYLEREQQNKSLGDLGEELVMDYEKWNLRREGKSRYADQVRWVSREDGDGAGYDIFSKDLSGKDKYIEVKTTKLSKKTPIYFSKNELDFSVSNQDKFYLYRLFNFEKDARMFIRQGALNQICQSQAINFKGYF